LFAILKRAFVLCFLFGCVSLGYSQPVSLTRFLGDSSSVVKNELAKMAAQPFDAHADSIIKHIATLIAYQAWSKTKRIEYFTTPAEKADIYSDRAQSEWMLGMFKFAVLPYFVTMESGVLPVLESGIAHLDSTQYYFGKVNPYLVGQSLIINRIDSCYASLISSKLRDLTKKIKSDKNLLEMHKFQYFTEGINSFDSIRVRFPQTAIDQSLSLWFFEGLSDFEYKESH
jgi:hypothetical protein